MAVGHINWNPQASREAQDINSAVQQYNAAIDLLGKSFRTLVQMLDGGVATSYMQGKLGTDTVANAQALFDEVNSFQGKVLTDNSVDHVLTAAQQCIAKLS